MKDPRRNRLRWSVAAMLAMIALGACGDRDPRPTPAATGASGEGRADPSLDARVHGLSEGSRWQLVILLPPEAAEAGTLEVLDERGSPLAPPRALPAAAGERCAVVPVAALPRGVRIRVRTETGARLESGLLDLGD